jgi:hypothetical protein
MKNKIYLNDNTDSTFFYPYGKYCFDINLDSKKDQETLLYSWFYDEREAASYLVPVGSAYNKEIIVFLKDQYFLLDQHKSLFENLSEYLPLDKTRIEEIILKYGDPKLYPVDFYLFKKQDTN